MSPDSELALLFRLCQLFYQRQHHLDDIAAAVFDTTRQSLINMLLVIQLYVMPAGSSRE